MTRFCYTSTQRYYYYHLFLVLFLYLCQVYMIPLFPPLARQLPVVILCFFVFWEERGGPLKRRVLVSFYTIITLHYFCFLYILFISQNEGLGEKREGKPFQKPQKKSFHFSFSFPGVSIAIFRCSFICLYISSLVSSASHYFLRLASTYYPIVGMNIGSN